MKNTIKLLVIIAFLAIIGFYFTACDDGNGDGDRYGGNIVNKTGEAWVASIEGQRIGYIFNSNGTFNVLFEIGNMWEIEASGTYSTSGSTLTISGGGETQTLTYSVSGNSLTLTGSMGSVSTSITLTKMSVNIGLFTPPSNHTPLIQGQWMNGNITTDNGEVWYSFSVTSGTTYRIWVDDSYDNYASSFTGDIMIRGYYSNGTQIWQDGSQDDIWDTPASFTANSSGTVYIRATPYETGTFAIVYSTGSTRP